jgi:hypothetical protein
MSRRNQGRGRRNRGLHGSVCKAKTANFSTMSRLLLIINLLLLWYLRFGLSPPLAMSSSNCIDNPCNTGLFDHRLHKFGQ